MQDIVILLNRQKVSDGMKYYTKLLKMGCFSWDELCEVVGSRKAADSIVRSYTQKGYIQSVKRSLYVAIDLATGESAVSKFLIASRVTPTSYVSHHAAFDYYGCTNQVSYQVKASSDTVFSSFDYAGITYTHIKSRINDGIVSQPDSVRITDTERTILDGINDFEKVMGLEELLRCLELLPLVREEKLLTYLNSYGKQVLYQKTGYILWHFRNIWNLSNEFFSACEARVGKSKRYLYNTTIRDEMVFDRRWRLIVPHNLMGLVSKGVNFDADI